MVMIFSAFFPFQSLHLLLLFLNLIACARHDCRNQFNFFLLSINHLLLLFWFQMHLGIFLDIDVKCQHTMRSYFKWIQFQMNFDHKTQFTKKKMIIYVGFMSNLSMYTKIVQITFYWLEMFTYRIAASINHG